LKVSYIQEIGGNSIYSKDRVDVERNGAFRFFLPNQELLGGKIGSTKHVKGLRKSFESIKKW
jgi:hypothetical protein